MSNKKVKKLIAPEFSDAINGSLRKVDIQAKGVRTRVPVYAFMSVGDNVALYLEEYPEDPVHTFPERKTVTEVAPLLFETPAAGNYMGWETLKGYYTVTKKDGAEKVESDSMSVKII